MSSPVFHRNELDAQVRAGGGPRGAAIREFMPEQHRAFFEHLPYLLVGIPDARGWPLATLISGEAGFVRSPDPVTLRVTRLPDRDDPAREALVTGAEAAVLGIDLATRRRNRANGRVAELDEAGFTVSVRQSFGNCPQYIQRRVLASTRTDVIAPVAQRPPTEVLGTLDVRARELIERADTFFVASRSRPEAGPAGGLDISHRGGRPGFVRVQGDTLTIPDFRGNRYFNTLGNLLGEPRAGLLFLDFATGELLQLQGRARIDWSPGAAAVFEGAERLWHFETQLGWRRRTGTSLRWSWVDFSPVTERTGSWIR